MRAIILGSGSKGNSTLVIGNNKKILIDVGFSYPKMIDLLKQYDLKPSDIDAILVTHTHKDHIIGLSSFLKRNMIPVYTNSLMYDDLLKNIKIDTMVINDDDFTIDEFNVGLIHTSHDAKGSVGYVINQDKHSLVYITDTGYINSKFLEKMKNKDVYIFESNHDIKMLMNGPYPYILKQRVVSDKGHLSNEQSGNYLNELIGKKTKIIVLAHLSEINNTPEIALKTVSDIINQNIDIKTAWQNESLDIGEI